MPDTKNPITWREDGTMDTADYINKMYDANLSSEQTELKSNYDTNLSNLDAQKQKNQRSTDTNLSRTYVEAAKAAKNYGEIQNAYGLSSGSMAQARLSQDNQLQADLTALRTAQQTADAEVERQRSVLSQQYAAAIQKAKADNDLQRAQALYQAAKDDEARLLELKQAGGQLVADRLGDYTILGKLCGLTPEQLAILNENSRLNNASGGSSGGGGGRELTGIPALDYGVAANPGTDTDSGGVQNTGVSYPQYSIFDYDNSLIKYFDKY